MFRLCLAGLVTVVVALGGCSCSDDGEPGARGDGAAGGRDGGGAAGGDGASLADGVSHGDGAVPCGEIPAVVRDFDVSHSDFEDENPGHTPGLVMDTLDVESKPLYAHGGSHVGGIENEGSFRQWYRDVDGVNMRFDITLPLTEIAPGVSVYDDDHFFPVDGRGFGMSGRDHGDRDRNFHFTTEIHTAFVYEGGESFTFRGDDDLWLFVDGRLAIDSAAPTAPSSARSTWARWASRRALATAWTSSTRSATPTRATSESRPRSNASSTPG